MQQDYDSPPEKDIQWSDEGIEASYKFIQKLWILHKKIINEMDKNHQQTKGEKLERITNQFIKDITNNLNNFSYNIAIANIHEMHNGLSKELNSKYKKETIANNYRKILTCLMPIIPHFSSETLATLNTNNEITWPKYDNELLKEETIPYVIQVNGKKRALIMSSRNSSEEDLFKKVVQLENLQKYFTEKNIRRKIFVPGKLINIIV